MNTTHLLVSEWKVAFWIRVSRPVFSKILGTINKTLHASRISKSCIKSSQPFHALFARISCNKVLEILKHTDQTLVCFVSGTLNLIKNCLNLLWNVFTHCTEDSSFHSWFLVIYLKLWMEMELSFILAMRTKTIVSITGLNYNLHRLPSLVKPFQFWTLLIISFGLFNQNKFYIPYPRH